MAMADSTSEAVVQPTPTITPDPTPTTAQPEPSQQELGEGPIHQVEIVMIDGIPFPVGAAAPVPPPPPDPPKINSPFIGDAETVFSDGAQHICGWDYQVLGGWGWGACSQQLIEYMTIHCSANDGVVYPPRCEELANNTLPLF